MATYSDAMDRTEGPIRSAGRGPRVVSIIFEYMGMVLGYPCLALEAKLVQTCGM